ncbi:MAG TPA: GGDEF domain-containing protein [Acidimicrobiales bacterium]|nr:GGDEF domain-containing protein [Acidimicrobiales bacterium]
MSDIRTIGRGQARQLQEFRSSEESRLLARLAQTECLLDLAKLPGLRIDLASYAGLVVGIITQFVPSRACWVAITVSDVPPISTYYGQELAEVPEGCRQQLLFDDEPAGELVVVPEVEHLSPPEFIRQIAEQVSSSLGALVEAERLRRQAAIAQTIHLVELLSDQPTTEDLTQLVSALASLPNALGARLEIAHLAIGGAVSLTAGASPLEPPEHIGVPGGSVGVAIRWATTNQPGDNDTLGEIVHLISVALGKAEERQQLRDQAETDPLTGIGNRRRALRSLAAAIGLAEQTDDRVGVVYLDLDHFKKVNDTHGHDVGDKVLTRFAAHLQQMVRAYDTVNRIGGEEFLIVCPGLDQRAGEALAQRIIDSTPAACADALPPEWKQTASAGVACYPTVATYSEGLLQAADRALYRAKNSGRDQVQVATSSEVEKAS